jgi:hypothetical protein
MERKETRMMKVEVRNHAAAAGAIIFSLLLGVLAASCGPDKNSCNYRCQHDEACWKAMEYEGITPFGSTRNDPALCNGICSAYNASIKERLGSLYPPLRSPRKTLTPLRN